MHKRNQSLGIAKAQQRIIHTSRSLSWSYSTNSCECDTSICFFSANSFSNSSWYRYGMSLVEKKRVESFCLCILVDTNSPIQLKTFWSRRSPGQLGISRVKVTVRLVIEMIHDLINAINHHLAFREYSERKKDGTSSMDSMRACWLFCDKLWIISIYVRLLSHWTATATTSWHMSKSSCKSASLAIAAKLMDGRSSGSCPRTSSKYRVISRCSFFWLLNRATQLLSFPASDGATTTWLLSLTLSCLNHLLSLLCMFRYVSEMRTLITRSVFFFSNFTCL